MGRNYENCRTEAQQAFSTSQVDHMVDEYMVKRWKSLAGPLVDTLLKDKEVAESYLNDPDPKLRRVALSVIRYHWKPYPKFTDTCERLMVADPNPEVRNEALGSLIGCYENNENPRIGKLLATIVHDHLQPFSYRYIAYEGLFLIRGIPLGAWPKEMHEFNQSRFVEQVDWSFVDSFLKSEK